VQDDISHLSLCVGSNDGKHSIVVAVFSFEISKSSDCRNQHFIIVKSTVAPTMLFC